MNNQVFALPAERFLLEEINLPPELIDLLLAKTVAVRFLEEQPGGRIEPQSLSTMQDGEFWVDPQGNYWRGYAPLRIFFTDSLGREWRFPRRWLQPQIAPRCDSCLPVESEKCFAEELNLPSEWDLLEINLPAREVFRIAGEVTTVQIRLVANEPPKVFWRDSSGLAWRIPHDWRRRRIRLPAFDVLLSQGIPPEIAERSACQVVSVNYHPGSLCCLAAQYRFRDEEGNRWPIGIDDCIFLGYGDGHEQAMKPSNDADRSGAPRLCACGCAQSVGRGSRFRPGHDRRYYALLGKVERGRLSPKDLPAAMQQNLQWHNCAGCGGPIPTSDPWGEPNPVGVACPARNKPSNGTARQAEEREMRTDRDRKNIQGVYDHHRKAGNQGDVVKHVALIAALDVVLVESLNRPPLNEPFKFKYADTFAGYAYNPLVPGNGWKDGIKKFHDIFRQRPPDNPHVEKWNNWYVSVRPQLLGGVYPGSSLIAADLCAEKKVPIRISLWDTCLEVIQNLDSVFGGQGHAIHYGAASISEEEVDSADFLFIDPPDNRWREILEFVQKGQSALLWLPVCVNTQSSPPPESQCADQVREEARKEGCSVTKVRWAAGGRMVGCQLIYRMSREARGALRTAVEYVVRAAGEGWSFEHFDPNTPVG